MNSKISIYCIYNPETDKRYVGQTSQGAAVRWNQHQRDARRKKNQECPLYRAIQKYGANSFELVELGTAQTQEEADNLEKIWIILLQSDCHKQGYNIREGGYRGRHSEETKKKISVRTMGRLPSEETREKMRSARIGKHFSYGPKISAANCKRVLSEETKAKIGAKSKGRWLGRKHLSETILKMKESYAKRMKN